MKPQTIDILIDIAIKNQQILTEITQQTKNIGPDAQRSFNILNTAIDEMNKNLAKSTKSATSFVAAVGQFHLFSEGIQKIGQMVGKITQPFKEIDEAITNMRINGVENIEQIRKSVAGLQTDVPLKTAEAIDAMNRVINTGFISLVDGVASAQEATLMLERVGKLAAVTGADIGDLAQRTGELMNVMGESIDQLPMVMDKLSLVANNTNFNILELSSSFKQIVPVTKEAGISLDELSSIYVTLGRNGQELGSIQTGIATMLNQLQSPSKELEEIMRKAGVSMYTIATEGFAPAVEKMKGAMNELGVTAGEVFGPKMEGTFNRLAENTEEIAAMQGDIADDAVGTLDANFDKVANSIEHKSKMIMQAINTFYHETLSEVLAPIAPITEGMTVVVTELSQMAFAFATFSAISLRLVLLIGVEGKEF